MPNFWRVPLPGEQSNPGSRQYIYRFPDSRTVFWSNPKSRKYPSRPWKNFSVDEENCREPAKQQRMGKNRTRRKQVVLFIGADIQMGLLLKFIHFQLCIQNKTLTLLVNSWITSNPQPSLILLTYKFLLLLLFFGFFWFFLSSRGV